MLPVKVTTNVPARTTIKKEKRWRVFICGLEINAYRLLIEGITFTDNNPKGAAAPNYRAEVCNVKLRVRDIF
jgi:hypothetical protein